MTSFQDLGLAPGLLRAIETLGFTEPTPIQRDAIPHVLAGRDLLGLAQTGTGKTAAFGLPLVHQLLAEGDVPHRNKAVRSLILAPTRELANQIADNLRAYVRRSHLKVAVVVGGASINAQVKNLARGTDILVATPGRLLDLVDRRAVDLGTARYLVLDEADQMLDLGFIHALRQIAKLVASPRQTLLFSATMPRQMAEIADAYLSDPVRVQVSAPGKAADEIAQSVHFVEQAGKLPLLKESLAEDPDGLSLVFARTKHGAEKLMKTLVAAGFDAASIHGNKSQNQRERAIRAFRDGDIRVLVATDVAARGIDIPGVSHVYNYDLPEVPEAYVHRIGRTARAGRSGRAVAFCIPDETGTLRQIEKLMGLRIEVASGEPGPDNAVPPKKTRGGRPGGGAPRGGPKPGRPARKPGKSAQGESHGAPRGRRDGAERAAGAPSKPRPQRRRRRPGREAASV